MSSECFLVTQAKHFFRCLIISVVRSQHMMKTNKPWKAVRRINRMENVSLTAVVWRACVAGRPMPQEKPNMIDKVKAIISYCFHFFTSSFFSLSFFFTEPTSETMIITKMIQLKR